MSAEKSKISKLTENNIDYEFQRRMNLHGDVYHFDNSKPDSYGETVRTIGRVVCDFSADVYTASQNAKSEFWGTRKENPDVIYGYDLANDTPNLNRVIELLNLETVTRARVQIQNPGSVVTNHLDDFTGKASTGSKIVRFLIPLQNWESGQTLTFGNTTMSQWKSGDIIYSDYEKIPHSTSNASWNPRSLLVVTGVASQKTIEILAFNLGTVVLEQNTNI